MCQVCMRYVVNNAIERLSCSNALIFSPGASCMQEPMYMPLGLTCGHKFCTDCILHAAGALLTHLVCVVPASWHVQSTT